MLTELAGTSDVPPYVPVSTVDQASAMQMLADYVFSPRVDMIDQTLLQHLTRAEDLPSWTNRGSEVASARFGIQQMC